MTAPDPPGEWSEVLDWLDRFAAAVRGRDYAAGRALFAEDVVGFGTVADRADGLPDLESRQWRRVWDSTSGFAFDPESVVGEVRDGVAWVAASWSSKGVRPDGGPFPRAGRATIALRRDPAGWRATHTHFSFLPSRAPAAGSR